VRGATRKYDRRPPLRRRPAHPAMKSGRVRHDRTVDQGEAVLKLTDLRRVCSLLLDEVERCQGGQIDMADVPVDYYWNVGLAAAFDMTQGPEAHLDCGQISDDVEEVSELARGKREIALTHDLSHLAAIMRLLAFLDLPACE
jgi:hypothetical protein